MLDKELVEQVAWFWLSCKESGRSEKYVPSLFISRSLGTVAPPPGSFDRITSIESAIREVEQAGVEALLRGDNE